MTLSARLRVIHRARGTHRRKIHLTHVHFRKKLASRASCRRTRIRLTHATALIPSLRHHVSLGRGSVSFLIKRFPAHVGHIGFLRRLSIPRSLPMNLPSSLLRHHPSIHTTRRRLGTRRTEIGITCAGVFPHLTLAKRFKLRDSILSGFLRSPCSLLGKTILTPLFN